MYESELTLFIKKFLQDHPDEVKKQAEGRSMWWDHAQNLDEMKRRREAKLPQQAYPYVPKVE